MPLINFGSVLNFAEELETNDQAFYSNAANTPALEQWADLFNSFVTDCQKNIKTLRRVRRENVTEMILEGIVGFTRESYTLKVDLASQTDAREILETARALETRAKRYYLDAAEKIKSLSEVARELKRLAKKRSAHLDKINA